MVEPAQSHKPILPAAQSSAPEGAEYLTNNYARSPIMFVAGHGAHIKDQAGRDYLDFVSGVAVNTLGHCHPRVVEAVREQVGRLIHVSNLYYNEPQIQLAQRLVNQSFADQVFFCNSGAEANEAAIKLARKWAKEHRGTDTYEIVTMEGSFHGRTMATLSATGQRKIQQGFDPLLPGFRHVPYDDLGHVEKAIGPQTAAILVEPIQGEGGVRVPHHGYLTGLRRLCTEQGILLILDEVQTGMGRTGRLFAYEHEGVSPDIMTLAKGLGSGLPIGAMLAVRSVAESLTPGSHASTFGGNPLVCAAALATLDVINTGGAVAALPRNGRLPARKTAGVAFPPLNDYRGSGQGAAHRH